MKNSSPYISALILATIVLGAAAGALANTESEHGVPPMLAWPPESSSALPEMPERFQDWLRQVEILITVREKALFKTLTRDYQREAFIKEFWKVRDPYPRTGRNELKERWPIRLAEVEELYGGLDDDRSRIYLIHGRPSGVSEIRCGTQRIPVEAWGYQRSEQLDFPFILIFYRITPNRPARLWRPAHSEIGFEEVLSSSTRCLNAGRLKSLVDQLRSDPDQYRRSLAQVVAKPRPRSSEWVDTFIAYSTDLPESALPLRADLDLAFLGKTQSRTVVHGLIRVPIDATDVAELSGYRSYDLRLTGEVLREGHLFESFRYRFGFDETEADSFIPLAFQRFLRPGDYRLILRLDDLNSERVWRTEQDLQVPRTERMWTPQESDDPFSSQLFAEATEALAAGETSIRLIAPQDGLLTGPNRFETLVNGDSIAKVQFYLDHRVLQTRNRPPFSVEIDLGSFPDLHVLEARAMDTAGLEVASDQLLVNGGGYRFEVELVEPRPDARSGSSLRVKAEVLVPDGRSLDRLELFVDDRRVATLYQEPFVHPLILPDTGALTSIRAVAYLPDGHSTEDTVFINAPDYLENVDVQFVELFATVLDRKDRPVQGLEKSEFEVLEDGIPQEVVRFERVADLPIHVGVVLDNSASMVSTLDEVRGAARRFFESTIRPQDRAAVITFNSFPSLAVELTSDRAALGRAMAGLVPEGRTALYDSLMFALYYFTGIKGQRALLVLSDGKDEASRFDFQQTMDYAKRAGITIYSLGLRINDGEARRKLDALAEATGGRSFHIWNADELDGIYSAIQEELRSQYLLAYQSDSQLEDGIFRTIEVRAASGHSVKTMSGYYP